ncbi:hypothetical protein AVEN_45254-1 [Araneus ventricosus]|uniref:Uncharacterized protein n=1 Tax=Araneus ventricosus TaxID=182803 RepID=A0A4Y2T2Y3_ARAVE|nr:hypothetical protein AVEN_45254-1 [Araneus ventricosus]
MRVGEGMRFVKVTNLRRKLIVGLRETATYEKKKQVKALLVENNLSKILELLGMDQEEIDLPKHAEENRKYDQQKKSSKVKTYLRPIKDSLS